MIDRILEEDRSLPKKQRHTAKRIYDRLRAEHGFGGKYTIVKDYVRERRLRTREMYVPLSHPPGDAQCDFGQAKAVIGGVEQTIHYFVLDLPHSDVCFVKAYPAETTEAFCDGHVSALARYCLAILNGPKSTAHEYLSFPCLLSPSNEGPVSCTRRRNAVRPCQRVRGYFRSLQRYCLRIPLRLILVIHWSRGIEQRHDERAHYKFRVRPYEDGTIRG